MRNGAPLHPTGTAVALLGHRNWVWVAARRTPAPVTPGSIQARRVSLGSTRPASGLCLHTVPAQYLEILPYAKLLPNGGGPKGLPSLR